jgi:hypothetical protein
MSGNLTDFHYESIALTSPDGTESNVWVYELAAASLIYTA